MVSAKFGHVPLEISEVYHRDSLSPRCGDFRGQCWGNVLQFLARGSASDEHQEDNANGSPEDLVVLRHFHVGHHFFLRRTAFKVTEIAQAVQSSCNIFTKASRSGLAFVAAFSRAASLV